MCLALIKRRLLVCFSEPASSATLLNVARTILETPGLLKSGPSFPLSVETKYTVDMDYEQLVAIYEKALQVSRDV